MRLQPYDDVARRLVQRSTPDDLGYLLGFGRKGSVADAVAQFTGREGVLANLRAIDRPSWVDLAPTERVLIEDVGLILIAHFLGSDHEGVTIYFYGSWRDLEADASLGTWAEKFDDRRQALAERATELRDIQGELDQLAERLDSIAPDFAHRAEARLRNFAELRSSIDGHLEQIEARVAFERAGLNRVLSKMGAKSLSATGPKIKWGDDAALLRATIKLAVRENEKISKRPNDYETPDTKYHVLMFELREALGLTLTWQTLVRHSAKFKDTVLADSNSLGTKPS